MSMSDQEWRDIKKDVNRGGLFGIGWVITIIIVVALVSVAGWGISVLVSGIRGQGNAVIIKNDAVNRIQSQELFEDMYQDILAADRRIDVMKTALDADPDDPTLKTNYTGTVSYCLEIVGDYNAEARKYTAEAFRAVDLPSQIDNFNPTTDCQPASAS